MRKYKVSKIEDGYNIIITAGAKDGIIKNEQFIIYSLDGEEIFDPDTGKSLGNLETVKGTGLVSFIEDQWCRITSDRYRAFTPEDAAISVSPQDSILNATSKSPQIGDKIHVPFSSNISVGDFAKRT